MTGTAIVAIPEEFDYVWKVSSEQIPHMTLLFLGEVSGSDAELISEFLQHLVDVGDIYPFGLDVANRGTLGPDDADVVFFRDDYSLKAIEKARNDMLANATIRAAYNSTDQFPQWTPHLTLGYPATPAKPDPREYPGIRWVSFDRLALWTGDFTGPTFQLKPREEQSLAMSDVVQDVLSHHGVKGMKWGVRKDRFTGAVTRARDKATKEIAERTGANVVVRTKPGAGVRTVGGNKQPAHEDAIKARTAQQIAKKSTIDALSNEDLQKLVTRMNLESQYHQLASREDRRSTGEKFATNLLNDHGDTVASKLGAAGKLAVLLKKALNARAPKKK